MSEPWNRYDLTAARNHDRPGREVRPTSITIDCHSHIVVAAAADYVRPHSDPSAQPRARFSTPETDQLTAKQGRDRTPLMLPGELDRRLQDMEAMGLDMQLVMPAPFQCYYGVPAEIGAKAARMTNEGVAAYVAKRPDRFAALGTVPMQDGKAAAAELEHCMGTLGFRGVQILTNIDGRELSDPDTAPFWAAAERLGAVVSIHPNGFTEASRLRPFYFNNVIGNPFDTTLALHHLIFDGVLERHPALKLLAVHGGGYLAAYSGRIDHAWGARSDSQGSLPHPPTTYLKRIYVDTIVFTTHQLEALVKVFGADHVMMGTDYPFDMGEYDPIGHVMETGLDRATTAKLVGGTAAALFRMG
jgi:aminocarboxymuconate-semialdehyde decarboxylase